MINEKLDSLGTIIILIVVFLLPIFFIPFTSVPIFESKLFLLIVGVFTPVLIWTVARLKSNNISIPKEKFVLPLVALPFIALASSLFSGNLYHSIVGQGIDFDTVLMVFVLVLSFFVGVYLFNSKDKIIKFYLVLTTSALILFLYQLSKVFLGGDFLSFDNLFPNITSNMLGKWNDLAVFAGLITILSLITLDTLHPRGFLKIIFYTSLAVGVTMLVIVNFPLVWFVLGAISFILFIRSFLEKKFFTQEERSSTVLSSKTGISGLVLLILSISILFIFAGSGIQRFLSVQLGIAQIEARPSWQSTLTLTKEIYSTNAILGSGPNNFTKEWLLHKPISTNNTPFWNIDFSYGVGTIPTYFITHGALSVIAWILFFIFFFWSGVQTFVQLGLKPFDKYLSSSSFLSALFLWTISVFYVPHVILFFLAFLFTGIFLSVQIQVGIVKQKNFAFNENLKVGFVGVILLFVLLIVSATSTYVFTQKFIAAVYLGQASSEVNISGDIEKAERLVNRALLFSKSDLVYRATSEISLLKLTNIINQGEVTTETKKQFQGAIIQALESGRLATVEDKNYQNWAVLGRVYETLIPFNIERAYENAKISYEQALSLNPKNPRLALNIARIEVLNGNNNTARDRIADALTMKNDYIDAIYLLSQIEIREGKVSEAIDSIEAASFLAPQDPLVFFQLGILKYSERDYGGTIEALERSVQLDNDYANARYFLGLSYYQFGRLEDSVNEFNIVLSLNPDNIEVTSILKNIKAGRAPFDNLTQPNSLFEGFGLPVKE